MRKVVRLISVKGAIGAIVAAVAVASLAGTGVVHLGNPLDVAAAKPAAPPTPTITSGPTGTVNSKSATFTFTDSQAGVTFQCSLDGSSSTCTSPKNYTGLTETSHTFAVTATAGTSNPSSAATRTWSVLDTTPPPKPIFSKKPDVTSDKSKATFSLGDAESGVTFVCSLGDSLTTPPFSPCDKDTSYSNLTPDEYCFRSKAQDAAGNLSDITEFCWANFEKKTFGVSGSTTQAFYPGKSQSVDLTLSNPNNQAIKILSITITVASATKKNNLANPDCNGSTNLVVTKGLTATTVIVPASSTKTLSQLGIPQGQWPALQMPNLSSNQDGCKNTSFTINYTGTAGKA